MGISASKSRHKKSPFFICASSSNSKVHGSDTEQKKAGDQISLGNEDDHARPNGNTNHQHVKQSAASLRTVSRCSLKPGCEFSLSCNSNNDVPSIISSCVESDDIVSVHDLYNILNDGAMKPFIHDPFNILIVDSRDLQYYATSHVVTAKHHAELMASSNLTMNMSNYSMIVVYGNNLKDDRDTNELVNLVNDIKEYTVSDILILKDGFDVFFSIYPFLCTERAINSIADRKLLISYPSIILDNKLYQGRGDQATNNQIINVLNITHVVNITTEHKNAFPNKIKYLKLVLEDVSKTNLYEHFNKTSDFINNAICNGGCVLVHCNQGVSRSSTVTLAYLMKYKKWDLGFSFRTLKSRRSCSCPNSGFFKQLSDWEEHVFGRRLTNIDSL